MNVAHTEANMEKLVEKKQCLGCSIHNEVVATIGGLIASSTYFEVRQDFSVPIPGFMILTSKRHVKGIADFTSEERNDFIEFVYQMRTCMNTCLDIHEVTIVQEENSSHFHLWLFPWYAWMNPFGNDIASLRPIMCYAQKHFKDESYLNDVYRTAKLLIETMQHNRT